MIPFDGGVLSAFARCDGTPGKYRVHFSPDGKDLGGGERRYEGISPVTSMSLHANTRPPFHENPVRNRGIFAIPDNTPMTAAHD
jgi:hypothetical protein